MKEQTRLNERVRSVRSSSRRLAGSASFYPGHDDELCHPLVVCATAPNYFVLVAGLAADGATTVSAQLLVPLAGDIARDDQCGKVIGSIASGMQIQEF